MQRKVRCTDSFAKRTYEHYTIFVKKYQAPMSETQGHLVLNIHFISVNIPLL